MAQQFGLGQNGYLGIVAKAASSLVEGDQNRSKGKRENDVMSRLEGEAVKAIGAKLLSGETMSQPKSTGHLLNRVSTWHQDRYNGTNTRSGYGYNDNSRTTNTYGGGYGYEPQGYGYNNVQGYNPDPSAMNGYSGWNRPADNNVSLGRQAYYDNSSYEGYGNHGRTNDGYNGWNNNPPMSRRGYP